MDEFFVEVRPKDDDPLFQILRFVNPGNMWVRLEKRDRLESAIARSTGLDASRVAMVRVVDGDGTLVFFNNIERVGAGGAFMVGGHFC